MMLTRQRLLLTLLREAAGPVQATTFVKLAFLLGSETVVGTDRTYYHFVPYKFGPFSFALYQEIHALERDRFIEKSDDTFHAALGRESEMQELARELPVETTLAISRVVSTYARLGHDDLLRSVYARYPWYTLNTERADLCAGKKAERVRAATAVYTAGYHEESIDGFLDRLLKAGISRIADVRANPVSRKYGFAGSRLKELAGKVGIAYSHSPRLGIPSSFRRELVTAADYDALFRTYADSLLPAQPAALVELEQTCAAEPTALLCAEADPRFCHRSALADRIAAHTGMAVVHL